MGEEEGAKEEVIFPPQAGEDQKVREGGLPCIWSEQIKTGKERWSRGRWRDQAEPDKTCLRQRRSSTSKSQQISYFLTTDFQLPHSLDSSDPSKDVIVKDKSQAD